MTLGKFKSLVYDRISSLTDDEKVLYQKVFLYSDVPIKLSHNLEIMPKSANLKGEVYIWAFEKGEKPKEPLLLKTSQDYSDWKGKYRKYIKDFGYDEYLYYIETRNEKLGKTYRTIILLYPKNTKEIETEKMIKSVQIPEKIKNEFHKTIDKTIKTVKLPPHSLS